MLDDGLNGDAVSGDGIYTARVPFNTAGDAVKYYIRTENAAAMALSPRRAEYEFYTYTVAPVVGLQNILDESALQVFPNPTSDATKIDFEGGLIETLEVLDITGKRIYNIENIQATTYVLDGSQLVSGAYLLKVKTDKGLVMKHLVKH